MNTVKNKPWEMLSELVEARRVEETIDFLESLSPQETALALSRLDEEERTSLLMLISPTDAAELIEDLSDEQAALILSELSPDSAGRIVEELHEEQIVDVLQELDSDDAEEILQTMLPASAQAARTSLSYSKDTAGNLMIHDFVLPAGYEHCRGQQGSERKTGTVPHL